MSKAEYITPICRISQSSSNIERLSKRWWAPTPSADIHHVPYNNHHRLRFIFQAGERLSHPWFQRASQVALMVKSMPAKAGDTREMGLSPGLGKSPGGGNGNPFQNSCLENSRDRGVWQATVHGVAKSQTRLQRLNNNTWLIQGSNGKEEKGWDRESHAGGGYWDGNP